MSKQVIIVGGGIGGLVSACLLCKEGYTPIVLEQHYKIGGGLHCFRRNGVVWEAGIHYVSGFEEGGTVRKIFDYLGITDSLDLKPLDENGFDVLHVAEDNTVCKFGVGKENFIRILSEQFPHETEGIRKYVDSIYAICDRIPLFNLRPNPPGVWYLDAESLLSVSDYIDTYVSDERVRKALAWNNSLYSGERDAPIYVHALISKFYIEGASRIVGGSQIIADKMVELIEAHGGKVYTSTNIVKFEVTDGMVQKVIAADGREFSGDYYISDVHPSFLMDLFEPGVFKKAYRERLQSLENSYSAFIIYATFKPKSFPFMNHNYYYYKNYDGIWDAINYTTESFPPGFMLTTPPKENQDEYAEKCMISCMMRYSDVQQWSNSTIGKRGESYEAFKKEIEEKLLDLTAEVFPNIRECIDKTFTATPLTIEDYVKSKHGGLYGYKKNSENIIKAQIIPRTKIQNLFLTGQNINLHGIIGTPLSAIVTVGELVGVEHILEKINTYKK